jgi:hypothetical protein
MVAVPVILLDVQTRINSIFLGFEVLTALTAVVMKSSVVWDITLRSPLKVNRRFGGTCHLHFQARRISQGRNQRGRQNSSVAISTKFMA